MTPADVVRDTPTILRKKIEDVRGVGATLLRRLRVIEDLSATQFSQEQLLSIDAGVYTDRERATLAWTEAVTLLSIDHVPDQAAHWLRERLRYEPPRVDRSAAS